MLQDARISSLVHQLELLGYMPVEIRSIIRETIEPGQLDNITAEQADELIKCLESYIVFAEKCKKIR